METAAPARETPRPKSRADDCAPFVSSANTAWAQELLSPPQITREVLENGVTGPRLYHQKHHSSLCDGLGLVFISEADMVYTIFVIGYKSSSCELTFRMVEKWV